MKKYFRIKFDRIKIFIPILILTIFIFSCKKNKDVLEDVKPAADTINSDKGHTVSTLAQNLDTPWQIAFAPDGRIFFTERVGHVKVIENGVLRKQPWLDLRDTAVLEAGEAGLTGIAIDPNFSENHYIYLAYSYEASKQPLQILNKLVRYREDVLTKAPVYDKVLIDSIEGYINHNGGPIYFGPDDKIYWPHGERYIPEYAQDLKKLNGKILRLNRDGSIPSDNPFPNSYVYTYGHRNVQGLAWQPVTNNLFNTEHGPSQTQGCCLDEINLIEKGKNYGWPVIRGGEKKAGMETPLYMTGDTVTWAPGLATFIKGGPWDGDMIFSGLFDQTLHRVIFDKVDPKKIVKVDDYFKKKLGRLRAVAQGPDGKIYISTSNGDGRGIAKTPNDDRILVLNISQN